MKNSKISKESKIKLLKEFYGEFGREPKTTEEYKGVKLGYFLKNICKGNTKISETDKKSLEALGINLTTKGKQILAQKKVLLICQFYNEFGREPKYKEEYKGVRIGCFLYNVRKGNTKIPKECMDQLENLKIKMIYISKKDSIHRKVLLLGEFYNKFGREPKQREEYKDEKIGRFLNSIKNGITNISESDRDYLEDLGIILLSKNKQVLVHKKVLLLGDFYNKFEREPKCGEEYEGVKLGRFLSSIRIGHTKISEEDKNYLESLGIRVVSINKQELVHEKVLLIGEFYKKFGREPKQSEEYKDEKIGRFLNTIRTGGVNIIKKDREYLENLGIRLVSKNKH